MNKKGPRAAVSDCRQRQALFLNQDNAGIKAENMEKIIIGKITGAVGLKGEVKIYSYSGDPKRFEKTKTVTVKNTEMTVEKVRYRKNLVVVKFRGVNDRDAAERLRGNEVFMDESELEEKDDGSVYIRDMIGMDVVDRRSGEVLGVLQDVLTDRPQDLYVVKRAGREKNGGKQDFYIPAVDAFVKDIDTERGVMTVELIEVMM